MGLRAHRRISGSHNNSRKPPPSALRPNTCCTTMTANMGTLLLDCHQHWYSGASVLPHSPNLNAVCERFIGSLRRECLDHILFINERQLHKLVQDNVLYLYRARPHQCIGHRLPDPSPEQSPVSTALLQSIV